MKQTENKHLPKSQRDDMARVALAMSKERRLTNAEARQAVAGMFKVSVTTAKRLISRGAFLALQERTDA